MASWLLLACAKRTPEPSFFPLLTPAEEAPPRPAAQLSGGTWVDAELPLRMDVPPGWVVTPGLAGEEVRLRLREDLPDGFVGAVARVGWPPGPRPGCEWTFQDEGRVAGLVVTVATCTPEEGARILVWWWPSAPGYAWELSLVLPPGRLSDASTAARTVLSRVRVND